MRENGESEKQVQNSTVRIAAIEFSSYKQHQRSPMADL